MDMSQVCEGGGNVNEPCGVDCSMYSDYVYVLNAQFLPTPTDACRACVVTDPIPYTPTH